MHCLMPFLKTLMIITALSQSATIALTQSNEFNDINFLKPLQYLGRKS